jgi:hypothetical protein
MKTWRVGSLQPCEQAVLGVEIDLIDTVASAGSRTLPADRKRPV